MLQLPSEWPGERSLATVVAAAGYDMRLAAIVERMSTASDPAALHALFKACAHAAGSETAVFISLMRGPPVVAANHFMLACDPAWCRPCLDGVELDRDPWLRYATLHSAPVVADDMRDRGIGSSAVFRTTESGIASVLLAPAHSDPGCNRTSLLCLGSHVPGYFQGDGVAHLKLWARLLAAELHDWWQAQARQELIAKARLTPTDLALLKRELLGDGSKRIAADLQTSVCSVNSRFQRLNTRLGVTSRRDAAELLAAMGLISR